MANININLNPTEYSSIEKNWTYRDIDIPIDDEFSTNSDVNAIRSSMANIFSWRQGQRILNPQFGNVLYSFLFEGLNDVTRENMKKSIMTMLNVEPRINVMVIDVVFNDDDDSEVTVNLQYEIPTLDRTINDTLFIS